MRQYLYLLVPLYLRDARITNAITSKETETETEQDAHFTEEHEKFTNSYTLNKILSFTIENGLVTSNT